MMRGSGNMAGMMKKMQKLQKEMQVAQAQWQASTLSRQSMTM